MRIRNCTKVKLIVVNKTNNNVVFCSPVILQYSFYLDFIKIFTLLNVTLLK